MHLKKTLILITVLSVLGASPLAAQLYGTWAGTGTGNAYPHPGVVIYPWSVWEGEVYISPDQDAPIFEGKWYDELGNYGIFKGNVLPISPSSDQEICLGEWFWYDPAGTSDEPVYGGDFKMTFWLEEGSCNGSWTTIWISSSDKGTMRGRKID